MNHEHTATIDWQCQGAEFTSGKYSREHTWSFDGGLTVPASPSPSIVPAPWSNAALVDPEEAFVASIASCHMLWWLSHAARHGYDVETYRDVARGVMTRNERGKLWVSRVTLRPHIQYGRRAPSRDEEAHLHELAHADCFIANSVRTEVIVEPPAT